MDYVQKGKSETHDRHVAVDKDNSGLNNVLFMIF